MVHSIWFMVDGRGGEDEYKVSFKFEKLQVWQKSIDFGANVHGLTQKFPKEELYILTSQIKRAADSVSLNIAEGSTGQSNAEFRQFIGYAIRSAIEVVSCLFIGKRRGLIGPKGFRKVYDEAETIIKMLQALRNSLKD
jgi:four helix bundle protein